MFKNRKQFDKAHFYLEKALRLDPKNEGYLQELGHLGYLMRNSNIELNALLGLYNHGLINPDQIQYLCQLLAENGKYKQALSIIQKTLKNFSKIEGRGKKALREYLIKSQQFYQAQMEIKQKLVVRSSSVKMSKDKNKQKEHKEVISYPRNGDVSECNLDKNIPPEIPVYIQVDPVVFKKSLADG